VKKSPVCSDVMAHLKSRMLDDSHSFGLNSFQRNYTGFLLHTMRQWLENKTGKGSDIGWDFDLRKSNHKKSQQKCSHEAKALK